MNRVTRKKNTQVISRKSISLVNLLICIAARQERAVANEDEVAMSAAHEIMDLWTKMCVADSERHQV